ncbi:hypothetical protein L226DRAFT_534827 [Lentinus tigrinus ALCF2SS1-7]|uniref:BZIP domain-containing protein n=1 Tax=Lentinus tigrinus ALCF2SS1-6 TaxID=1328759 RepID=A0A5C2SDG5_9APHY|nr:hypothetical protein L227DRAFT_574796 [Lentinus tigrinus ALCF2SS1-6]RPD75252.1 hypothetical protein L226DRAFT_534827 [Lentinus tigrinus ALCF2SS1-7]
MSSKRGRKRNDNLPPNRARDVQRAFRARRAAHLEALENRVTELEEENNALRAALNLPPANRPALGKGPTGKDKPKPGSSSKSTSAASGLPTLISTLAPGASGPPMSRTESPLSTGSASGQSMSPDPMHPGLSLPQTSPPHLDPTGWNENMFGDKESEQSNASTSFSLPPPASHNLPFPQIPRSAAGDMFSSPQGFATSDEKSFGFLPPDERRSFNYSHPLLSGHPSAQPSLPPSLPSAGGDDLAPYLQRRALTEPDSFRSLLNQMSHVPTSQNGLQTPAPRMSSAALLNIVDAPLGEYDLSGSTERRYPRLH